MQDLNTTFTALLAQNIDLNNTQMSQKLIAALVGDPMNNLDEGIEINGKRSSRVFLDVADLDYKAMYPYIKIKNNIERTVQYFRVVIMDKISNMENRRGEPIFWRGGEFIEDFSTKNILTFGRKWFGLKTITEYIREFETTILKQEPMRFILKPTMTGNRYTLTLKPEFTRTS